MMSGSLAELLGTPCRVRDVRIGEVAAVYVDAAATRVIGLDISSSGDVHRFLPWVAAELGEHSVGVRSVFLLVDVGDTYARLGAHAISDVDELAGMRVDGAGRIVGGEAVSAGGHAGMSLR